jgi:membrane protein implicated in regulation of membrane protease activity
MSEGPYWFARRFPVGHARNSMSPVAAEGYMVVRRFIFAMIAGAVVWFVLGALSVWTHWSLAIVGALVFIAAAIWGARDFIRAAQSRGDHNHTIEDYKAGRVPGQLPYAGR